MLVQPDLKNFVTDTLREAGDLLCDLFHDAGGLEVRYKAHGEAVTAADMASHDLITRRVREAFPHHHILSEEGGHNGTFKIGPEPTWVIDPLDGTGNFIRKIPIFGITLALVENGRTMLGGVYDCLHQELFLAQRGGGAFLNEKPIHVSAITDPKKSILLAGRGYRDRDKIVHTHIIMKLEQQTTYFRRLGCASLMLAYVAAGRANAVVLTGNQPWDFLAGILLVEEAGGKITDYRGQPWSGTISEDLLATNSVLHDTLIRLITAHEDAVCPVVQL